MDSSREDLLANMGFRYDDVYPDIAALLASDDPDLDEVKRILEQLIRKNRDDEDGGSKVFACLPKNPKKPWGGRRESNRNSPPPHYKFLNDYKQS